MTDLGSAQHSGCPRAVVSGGLSNDRGMDGCLTTEEAPEPICGSLLHLLEITDCFNSSSRSGFLCFSCRNLSLFRYKVFVHKLD